MRVQSVKTLASLCTALFFLASCAGTSLSCMANNYDTPNGKVKRLPGSAAKPGEILVKFKPGINEERVREIAQREGLVIIKVVTPPSLYLFKARDAGLALINQRISDLRKYEEIEYAEPNYISQPARN